MPVGLEFMVGIHADVGGSAGIEDQQGVILQLVINCLSFQLLPTTIMGLRISAGSENASSIIFPTILTSLITGVVTISVLKLIFKLKDKKDSKKVTILLRI